MAIGTTFTLGFDGNAVQRGMGSLKSSFTSITGAIGSITKAGLATGAMFAGAIAGAAALVIKLDEIGAAGRSGDRRLKNITKQMGLFGDKADEVSDRLIDAADAEAQLTGMDPQLVQTKLMTFAELAKTADTVGGAFDRATTAALDMEASGFGAAEQAAVQLGKALNDPIKGINSLSRSGITFTAQEKEKIRTLVESNQTLKAQDMILKAIEKQVGGTAAASATASSRLGKSMALVVESFAEEMSVAFDGVPEKFQAIMPKLMEFGGKAGKAMADALTDSIAGDHEKMVAIGELIGATIAAAATAAFQKGSVGIVAKTENAARGVARNLMGGLVDMMGGRGDEARALLPNMQGPSFKELLESQMINAGIAEKAQAIMGTGPQPYMPIGDRPQPGDEQWKSNWSSMIRNPESTPNSPVPQQLIKQSDIQSQMLLELKKANQSGSKL